MEDLKLSRFNQRTGLSFIPDWANSEILRDENIKNKEYYFFEKSEVIDVELDKIKFTTHCDYYNKTWFEAVLSFKRELIKDSSVAKEALLYPENYISKVSLNKYGNEFLITNGNHRCILSKFSDLKSFKSRVDIYKFNETLYQNHQEVRRLVKSENLQIREEEIIIHKNDAYKTRIIGFNNFNEFEEFYELFNKKTTLLKKIKFNLSSIRKENMFSWYYLKKSYKPIFEFNIYMLKTKLLVGIVNN